MAMEFVGRLWTVASWDDATCPRLTKKAYDGAVDRVFSNDDVVLISHDFVGLLIQMESQLLSRQEMIIGFSNLEDDRWPGFKLF